VVAGARIIRVGLSCLCRYATMRRHELIRVASVRGQSARPNTKGDADSPS
jgi:hypothetical protein